MGNQVEAIFGMTHLNRPIDVDQEPLEYVDGQGQTTEEEHICSATKEY